MSNLLEAPRIEAVPAVEYDQRGELQTAISLGSRVIQLSADKNEGVTFADIFSGRQPISEDSVIYDRHGRQFNHEQVIGLISLVEV